VFKKIKKWFKYMFSPKEPKNWNNFIYTIYFVERNVFDWVKHSTQLKIYKKIDDEGECNKYKYLFHRKNIPTKPKSLIKDMYFFPEFWFDL